VNFYKQFKLFTIVKNMVVWHRTVVNSPLKWAKNRPMQGHLLLILKMLQPLIKLSLFNFADRIFSRWYEYESHRAPKFLMDSGLLRLDGHNWKETGPVYCSHGKQRLWQRHSWNDVHEFGWSRKAFGWSKQCSCWSISLGTKVHTQQSSGARKN